MPRLQILELPTEHHGDAMVTPFALVIDQADDATVQALAYGISYDSENGQRPIREALKADLGARAIFVFTETVGIPANQVGDCTQFETIHELTAQQRDSTNTARRAGRMSWHRVRISSDGCHHTVSIDDTDVSRGLVGATLTLGVAGDRPALVLEPNINQVEESELDEVVVSVSDHTAAALVALGWTPPPKADA